MSPHLVAFRVHYTLPDSPETLHRDIDAESPAAAEAAVIAKYKPLRIAIVKTKRLKAQPEMSSAEQVAHGILLFGFGAACYLALIARTGGF